MKSEKVMTSFNTVVIFHACPLNPLGRERCECGDSSETFPEKGEVNATCSLVPFKKKKNVSSRRENFIGVFLKNEMLTF